MDEEVVIPEGYTALTVIYGDKVTKVAVRNDFTLEQKRQVFRMCGEALLRDDIEVEMRAMLAAEGFDFDEMRRQEGDRVAMSMIEERLNNAPGLARKIAESIMEKEFPTVEKKANK